MNTDVEVKKELIALFDAPKPKEKKAVAAKIGANLYQMRFACQDYILWTKDHPRAAEALREIYKTQVGIDLHDVITVNEKGKLAPPDTRNLNIENAEGLAVAINKGKEIKAALKYYLENYEKGIVDENEYTLTDEAVNAPEIDEAPVADPEVLSPADEAIIDPEPLEQPDTSPAGEPIPSQFDDEIIPVQKRKGK